MVRCLEAEILDCGDVTDEVVAEAYRELHAIHRWLGNTGVVLRLLRQGAGVRRVLDIGCGQGALLKEIRERLGVEVVGFDLRAPAVACPVPIVAGDATADSLPRADVAVCVTMAHHLDEEQLAALIHNVARSCDRLIVLDLVRHPVPLALFRAFVCPLVSRISALDGQTSIRRAYTAIEMRRIFDTALADSVRPVLRLRHTVGPLWIRQVVDVAWEPKADSFLS